jgi:hypothetical protein
MLFGAAWFSALPTNVGPVTCNTVVTVFAVMHSQRIYVGIPQIFFYPEVSAMLIHLAILYSHVGLSEADAGMIKKSVPQNM